MRCWHVLGGHLGFALLPVALVSGQPRPPIIDMHLHPGPGGDARGALDSTAVENYLGALRREYQAHNIVLGVLSGPTELVARWRRSAPDLFIGAPIFPCDQGIAPNGYTLRCLPDGHAWPDIKWLRGEYEATRFGAMGEILAQLAGVAPNDPRLEPYFALA